MNNESLPVVSSICFPPFLPSSSSSPNPPAAQTRESLVPHHHFDCQHQPQHQHQVRARLAQPGTKHCHPAQHLPPPAPARAHRPLTRRQPQQQHQLLRRQQRAGRSHPPRFRLIPGPPATHQRARGGEPLRKAHAVGYLGHITGPHRPWERRRLAARPRGGWEGWERGGTGAKRVTGMGWGGGESIINCLRNSFRIT